MAGPILYKRRDAASGSQKQHSWAGCIRCTAVSILLAGAVVQWTSYSESPFMISEPSTASASSRTATVSLPSIEDHKAALRYMGDKKLNTGWNIDELCLQRRQQANGGVDAPLIVYGVGAGEDISWDIGMVENYGATVIIIDPTEKAKKHVESVLSTKAYGNDPTKVKFFPEGLSDKKGEIVFALPANPKHVSMRSVTLASDKQTRTVTAPVRRLQDFMSELGHEYLDVFKIDIEGAEYDVLEALIRDNYLPFTQLLVEYHDRFLDAKDKARHTQLLQKLKDVGFIELWSQHGGQERGYVKANDLEYCATGIGKRSPSGATQTTSRIRLRN